ncbi:alpha/beta hydrolase [Actinomadura alba]|uniref:Alpha/beta hydrolase n=2 Tax=Actinomadura alba TaxID=406431 RepID=A0ABR7LR42_9ACTN|nr:alpha/beta hydrolase [Actinomadura alba]
MAKLPIVYVRGFAGSGIEQAVADPLYGFNEGSVHVRVGAGGDPIFYQFEGPLLRLHQDGGYETFVHGDQMAYLRREPKVDPASIWIHRFYDVSASSLSKDPKEFRLEKAAEDLLDLIELLQAKTRAPRVHLVAHSMGGLICRCLIQKIIPDRRPGRKATEFVDRLFTYGTPHRGIAFDLGSHILGWLRDAGVEGADVFGADRMYEYLTPAQRLRTDGECPEGWDPARMTDAEFPLDRICCLVGTDPEDYPTAHGLSALAVGPRSDGLVQIENAYVPGAHRIVVHRSHSGPYGLVNSEEGYQNLQRFLFGDLQVRAELVGHRRPPEQDLDVVWQAEVRLSVRGVPVIQHEQTAGHWCPIQLFDGPDGQPEPLAVTFLRSDRTPEKDQAARFSLQLRLLSLRQRDGHLVFDHHLEHAADFDDTLIVDVRPCDGRLRVWTTWNSAIGRIATYRPQDLDAPTLPMDNPVRGTWIVHLPLPPAAEKILGNDARIKLTAIRRT